MFILFTIYCRINFDFVVVYSIDDGSLEFGSETSGLVANHSNVLIILEMSLLEKSMMQPYHLFSSSLFCYVLDKQIRYTLASKEYGNDWEARLAESVKNFC